MVKKSDIFTGSNREKSNIANTILKNYIWFLILHFPNNIFATVHKNTLKKNCL